VELLDFTEIPIEYIGQTVHSSTSFSRLPGEIHETFFKENCIISFTEGLQ